MSPQRPLPEDPELNKPSSVKSEVSETKKITLDTPSQEIGSVLVENSNVKHCGATETELNSLLNSGDNFNVCLSASMVFFGIFITAGIEWVITDPMTELEKGVYPTLTICSAVMSVFLGYLAKTLKSPSKELIRKIVGNEPR